MRDGEGHSHLPRGREQRAEVDVAQRPLAQRGAPRERQGVVRGARAAHRAVEPEFGNVLGREEQVREEAVVQVGAGRLRRGRRRRHVAQHHLSLLVNVRERAQQQQPTRRRRRQSNSNPTAAATARGAAAAQRVRGGGGGAVGVANEPIRRAADRRVEEAALLQVDEKCTQRARRVPVVDGATPAAQPLGVLGVRLAGEVEEEGLAPRCAPPQQRRQQRQVGAVRLEERVRHHQVGAARATRFARRARRLPPHRGARRVELAPRAVLLGVLGVLGGGGGGALLLIGDEGRVAGLRDEDRLDGAARRCAAPAPLDVDGRVAAGLATAPVAAAAAGPGRCRRSSARSARRAQQQLGGVGGRFGRRQHAEEHRRAVVGQPKPPRLHAHAAHRRPLHAHSLLAATATASSARPASSCGGCAGGARRGRAGAPRRGLGGDATAAERTTRRLRATTPTRSRRGGVGVGVGVDHLQQRRRRRQVRLVRRRCLREQRQRVRRGESVGRRRHPPVVGALPQLPRELVRPRPPSSSASASASASSSASRRRRPRPPQRRRRRGGSARRRRRRRRCGGQRALGGAIDGAVGVSGALGAAHRRRRRQRRQRRRRGRSGGGSGAAASGRGGGGGGGGAPAAAAALRRLRPLRQSIARRRRVGARHWLPRRRPLL